MKRFTNGQLTLPIGFALAGISFVVSPVVAYFTGQMAIRDTVSQNNTGVYMDISKDRERIATLEEAIRTIKSSQEETRTDVKEILRRVK